MIVLDENIPESQRAFLRRWHIAARQIGFDVGRKGMKDAEIISLLHVSGRPTFFTLDSEFYERGLCHGRYCLVFLDAEEEEAARYVRRLLRHSQLNTRAKRMGNVIHVLPVELRLWHVHAVRETHLPWER